MSNTPPELPIAIMVQALRQAKDAEAKAVEHRRAIEAQIVSLYAAPDGGEGTVKDDEFSITYKATRAVDTDALQKAWGTLSPNTQKAFKWKADVDLKQLRALVDLDPDNAYQAQGFITTKPAKPTISLKEPSCHHQLM